MLLNVISNGFYAVAKRGSEENTGFEPVLSGQHPRPRRSCGNPHSRQRHRHAP